MTLKGKVAIVTGSTSRHRPWHRPSSSPKRAPTCCSTASATPARSSGCSRDISDACGVRTAYSGADMSKPDQIAGMVEQATARTRPGRHPGQQRRHPAHRARAGLPGRPLGRDHRHQSLGRLPRHQGGPAADAGAQLGPDHQHRQRAWPRRQRPEVGLCGREARHRRPHQGGGAGDGHDRRDLQRHLPRLGADPAGAEADRRRAPQREGIEVAQAKFELLAEKQPSHEFVTPEQLGRLRGLPVLGRRRADPRPGARRWTAAGPLSNRPARRSCATRSSPPPKPSPSSRTATRCAPRASSASACRMRCWSRWSSASSRPASRATSRWSSPPGRATARTAASTRSATTACSSASSAATGA